jgi:hypothetical protein
MTMSPARATRLVGAACILLGGSVHLQQWWTVFRDLDIGPLFILNALVSILVGTWLIARDDAWALAAGIALAVGSLVSLLASRTTGLLGFDAVGYDTAEIEAIVVEVLGAVVLIASFALRGSSSRRSDSPSVTSAGQPGTDRVGPPADPRR